MLLKFFYTITILSAVTTASAQVVSSDSTVKILDEVVVTATRTENKISNIPLPIQVITAKNIQLSGSQKLIDILQMQTGLVIANNPLGTALQGYPNPFGEGIQLQGLDPAYTLILLDGEPLTGRNAGIINLGRIAVGNIKQIEIIKGPATSLYGSDALAGVINIITEVPKTNSLQAKIHYYTNNTLGLTASAGLKQKKSAVQLFFNRYSSDGYDLDKDIYGKTIDPFVDYSANAKVTFDVNEKNKLTFSVKYFTDKQFNNYLIYTDAQPDVVKGTTVESEKSFFTKWDHTISKKINYYASLYATNYSNNATVFLQPKDSLYEKITLEQFLLKPEVQVNIGENPASLLVAGAGYNFESVNSSRYGSLREMNSFYLFAQKQFQYKKNTNIIVGSRIDKNSLYPLQLSPKAAIAYRINPDIVVKASIGAGFKAPDFRQQFLNFSNSLIGYTLLGAQELMHGLETLKKNGQIDQSIDISQYNNQKELSPEKSIGVNAGFDYTFKNGSSNFKLNFFRNDISNLIEAYNLPFNKINNQSIYSYQNLNKVFTEGVEAGFFYSLNKNFSISGGYQYLVAKDKEVLRLIKEEKLYKRDPVTNKTTLVTKDEYTGLFNRSRNTANLRLQYNNVLHKGSFFVTAKYRGRYGFSGLNGFQNGNDVLDDEREFVHGFGLINATVSKQFLDSWEVQAGIENILNYRNKLLMPNMFGRTFFINVNFKI